MTYDQLKTLSWQELMDLLVRTATAYRDTPDYTKLLPHPAAPLPAPLLCLLGDFEIRARFHDPIVFDSTTNPRHSNTA